MSTPSDTNVGLFGSLTSHLEPAAKASAIVFGFLYGIGFLIVSIHHASFGISEFSLFRPHIITTGVLFVLLNGLPVVLAHRIYSLGSPKKGPDGEPDGDPGHWSESIVRLGEFSYGCVALTVTTGVFIQSSSQTPVRGLLILLGSTVLVVLVSVYLVFKTKTTPQMRAVPWGVILILNVLLLVMTKNTTLQILASWFFGVGILGVLVSRRLLNREICGNIRWESEWGIFLSLVGLYTLICYPRLKPEFGGGGTRPAILYFSNSLSRHCFVLDENEQGFYVVFDPKTTHATFFPRSGVTAVFFGEDENEVKSELPVK
jgi:hypothetical protein